MRKSALIVAMFLAFAGYFAKADVGVFDGIITIGAPNLTGEQVNLSAVIRTIADDPQATAKGFVWSIAANPDISVNDDMIDLGAGASASPSTEVITHQLTGLTPNQVYHVKAFVTNADGTFYSQEVTFTAVPTLGEWGLIAFGAMIVIIGGVVVWRRIV